MSLDSFESLYHKKGSAVSAVPLVWGIAQLCGVDTPRVEGANAELDTNYEGKVDAVIKALEGGADFCCIHVEAPDEMGHQGNVYHKVQAIERIDKDVISVVKKKLDDSNEPYRILVLPDHPTPICIRTHTAEPVPYVLYDSRNVERKNTTFSEKNAADTGVFQKDGYRLMELLID